MHSDTWYDLAVRELAEMTDPAKEKLADLAETVDELELSCLSAQDEDGEAASTPEVAGPPAAPPARSADHRSEPRAA
jgi:hypothetical protein